MPPFCMLASFLECYTCVIFIGSNMYPFTNPAHCYVFPVELTWDGWQGRNREDQEQNELDFSDLCQPSTDDLNYSPNIKNQVHPQNPRRALWMSGWCSCKGEGSLFQLLPWRPMVLFISHHSLKGGVLKKTQNNHAACWTSKQNHLASAEIKPFLGWFQGVL